MGRSTSNELLRAFVSLAFDLIPIILLSAMKTLVLPRFSVPAGLSCKVRAASAYDDYAETIYQRQDTRVATVSFSYRFGNEKLAPTHKHQNGVEDEKRRAGQLGREAYARAHQIIPSESTVQRLGQSHQYAIVDSCSAPVLCTRRPPPLAALLLAPTTSHRVLFRIIAPSNYENIRHLPSGLCASFVFLLNAGNSPTRPQSAQYAWLLECRNQSGHS